MTHKPEAEKKDSYMYRGNFCCTFSLKYQILYVQLRMHGDVEPTAH